jgi:hypothetical protein
MLLILIYLHNLAASSILLVEIHFLKKDGLALAQPQRACFHVRGA